MHNAYSEDTTHSGGAAARYGGAFCPGKRRRSSDDYVHCPAGGSEPSNKGRVRWFACVPRRAFVQVEGSSDSGKHDDAHARLTRVDARL
jgi:hypothetical protein